MIITFVWILEQPVENHVTAVFITTGAVVRSVKFYKQKKASNTPDSL